MVPTGCNTLIENQNHLMRLNFDIEKLDFSLNAYCRVKIIETDDGDDDDATAFCVYLFSPSRYFAIGTLNSTKKFLNCVICVDYVNVDNNSSSENNRSLAQYVIYYCP